MSIDTKKHTSIAPGEQPSRAALAAALLSINDVVPVANATEQTQIATALGGAPVLGSAPLTTARQDAPGLHRIEIGYGASFVPASGVLHFTSNGSRDTWTAANSSLLVAGDVCVVGAEDQRWSGAAWIPRLISGRVKRSAVSTIFTPSSNVWVMLTGANLWQVDQPAGGGLAPFDGTWVVPTSGVYDVEAQVWAGVAVNAILILKKNSASTDMSGMIAAQSGAGAGGVTILSLRSRVRLNQADVLRLAFYATTGGIPWNTDSESSFFGLQYVEPLR